MNSVHFKVWEFIISMVEQALPIYNLFILYFRTTAMSNWASIFLESTISKTYWLLLNIPYLLTPGILY